MKGLEAPGPAAARPGATWGCTRLGRFRSRNDAEEVAVLEAYYKFLFG